MNIKMKFAALLFLIIVCSITAVSYVEIVIPRIIDEQDADNQSGNEPVDTLISAMIQGNNPGCQLFDYAPVGDQGTEYIVLARDSAAKAAVMIINTEQPSAGIEFCNDRIMEGIPLDKDKVQIMDHMSDGHPYLWYTNTDGPDFLYVVFRKSENGQWLVDEAQFGDDWHELYWFQYHTEDQKIHFFLSGNDLAALPDDVIDRNAGSFDPAAVRQSVREILEPYNK